MTKARLNGTSIATSAETRVVEGLSTSQSTTWTLPG
jgi:hypothetical protein